MTWRQTLVVLCFPILVVSSWDKAESPPGAYEGFLLVAVVVGSWRYGRSRQQYHAKLNLSPSKQRLLYWLENAAASGLIFGSILRLFTDYVNVAYVISWVGLACVLGALFIHNGATQKRAAASDAAGEGTP